MNDRTEGISIFGVSSDCIFGYLHSMLCEYLVNLTSVSVCTCVSREKREGREREGRDKVREGREGRDGRDGREGGRRRGRGWREKGREEGGRRGEGERRREEGREGREGGGRRRGSGGEEEWMGREGGSGNEWKRVSEGIRSNFLWPLSHFVGKEATIGMTSI